MSGVAALAFAAAFTSCSKSTDLYDGPKTEEPKPTNPTTNPEVVEAEIQAAYEAASASPPLIRTGALVTMRQLHVHSHVHPYLLIITNSQQTLMKANF